MKKLLLLFLAAGICLSGLAIEPTGGWYVTSSGKTDCRKITMGMNKARIELPDGKKFSLPIEEITSYSIEGKIYNKMQLYENGKPTDQMVFMELVKSHEDCNLYRFEQSIYEQDDRMTSVTTCCKYYVYRGDQFQMAIDQNSTQEEVQKVCKYFNLQAILQKTP